MRDELECLIPRYLPEEEKRAIHDAAREEVRAAFRKGDEADTLAERERWYSIADTVAMDAFYKANPQTDAYAIWFAIGAIALLPATLVVLALALVLV